MYAVICFDRPGSAPLRDAARQAHMDYIHARGDFIVFGGPLKSEDGPHSVGAVIILNTTSRDEAQAYVDGDPFTKAGVYESTVLRPFKKVLPAE